MVDTVSLQKIIDADWSRQYLTSAGTVATRSWFSRAVKVLSKVPFLGSYIPKPEIYTSINLATTAIKAVLTDLFANGANDPKIAQVAAKINNLVAHIAEKRPAEGKWNDVQIDLEALKPAPVVDDNDGQISDPVNPPQSQELSQEQAQEPAREPIQPKRLFTELDPILEEVDQEPKTPEPSVAEEVVVVPPQPQHADVRSARLAELDNRKKDKEVREQSQSEPVKPATTTARRGRKQENPKRKKFN